MNEHWSDLDRQIVEREARERVKNSPVLSPHYDLIFSDWENWDEHIQWVMHDATTTEILDWVESVKKGAE